MASLAPSSSALEAPARRPRPPSRKPAVVRQRRMAGSVVWIAVVGVLLAGVVAVNVAVLRLNVRLDHLSSDRARLQADTVALQIKLAAAVAAARIEQAAALQGMAPADASHTTYLTLPAR